MINGRTKIKIIESAVDMPLKQEEDSCDTIAGLVIQRAGRVPKKGETITINESVIAKIIDTTPKTIKKINMIISLKTEQIED